MAKMRVGALEPGELYLAKFNQELPQRKILVMPKTHLRGQLAFILLIFTLALSPLDAQENFTRGDCNLDDQVNIADAVIGLAILFSGAGPALCPDSCDINDDGGSDISDPIFLLGNLFGSGSPPPAPNDCGPDPTTDGLGCPTTSAGCGSTPEICDNGIDDDGDSLVDCQDPDCAGPLCVEICDNGVDDDFDFDIDCDDSDCTSAPNCAIVLSYSADIYTQVIEAQCTVCHAPPSNFGGLNLADTATNDSYATIVNQPSDECGAYDFVEPFDSQASWLFRKIVGTHVEAATAAGCSTAAAGSQMPIGGFCCLSTAEIQLIQDWIEQGAEP